MPGMAGVYGSMQTRGIGDGVGLTMAERDVLLQLQRRAVRFFLENQEPGGLILDRQSNRGPLRPGGLCSTSATGMGLIALALAAAPPLRLLSRGEAVARVRAALEAAGRLPHHRGVLPHFVDAHSGAVVGSDALSTIDTAWLVAGGLWAAAFLLDRDLDAAACRLYDRIDWAGWAVPDRCGGPGLLRHGKGPRRPLPGQRLGPNQRRDGLPLCAGGRGRGGSRAAGRILGGVAAVLRHGRGAAVQQRRPGAVRLPVRPGPAGLAVLAGPRRHRPDGRGRGGHGGQSRGLPSGGRHLLHLSPLLGAVGRRRPRRVPRDPGLSGLLPRRADRRHGPHHRHAGLGRPPARFGAGKPPRGPTPRAA